MGIYSELSENSFLIIIFMEIKLYKENYTYLINIMHHLNKLKICKNNLLLQTKSK